MSNEILNKNRATYNQIAPSYAQHWADRQVIYPHIDTFVSYLSTGSIIIDVGCGPGFDSVLLQAKGMRVFSMDYSAGMMQAGHAELGLSCDFVQGDMRALPFTAVHGLWVSASMLHLPRAEVPATLAGFARVLQPGGILYLSLKLGDGDGWTTQSYGHNIGRFYTYWQPAEIDTALKTAGFRILQSAKEPITDTTWLVRYARRPYTRNMQ